MTHTTDTIQKTIISKAITAERSRITALTTKYLADLGIGSSLVFAEVLVRTKEGFMEKVAVPSTDFFAAFQESLLEDRRELLSSTAITQFLLDYDAFCASKESPQ